jgi:hypothetical protein
MLRVSDFDRLHPRHERFVSEFFIDGNATAASGTWSQSLPDARSDRRQFSKSHGIVTAATKPRPSGLRMTAARAVCDAVNDAL